MFLTPPSRRPYELYYFCNIADDVVIITDKNTYSEYFDFFEQFEPFNFQYLFLPVEKLRFARFFNFSSTAAWTNYNDAQLSKIIQEKKITTMVSVEIFSALSLQASHLSSKFSIQHIVIIWENMERALFYFVPPFCVNTKIVKSAATKLIAVSNTSKIAAMSLGINEEKIETVYPGIFLDKFKPSADSTNKILFVGNMERSKGVHILLKAFQSLSPDFGGIELILVGEGALKSKIMKMKSSGLKISYHGYISHSALTDIYADSSIFCSPSIRVKKAGLIAREEQFGFTLVEAMASSLPIVSSNVGTIPEIIGKENLAVPPTVDNVLSALRELLMSNILRRRLRDSNKDRCISKFNALTQSTLFEVAISK